MTAVTGTKVTKCLKCFKWSYEKCDPNAKSIKKKNSLVSSTVKVALPNIATPYSNFQMFIARKCDPNAKSIKRNSLVSSTAIFSKRLGRRRQHNMTKNDYTSGYSITKNKTSR